MKRIWTTTLAVSLLALSACKGGASADAVKLIPDEAEFIIGFSPKAITDSEGYKAAAEKFEQETEYKEIMAIFEGCNLKPTEFDAIVMGATQAEQFAAVIVGDGVGDEENAVCIVNAMLKESGKEANAEVTKADGRSFIEVDEMNAYLVNKNTMAVTSSGWKDKVGELIDGKGTPAIEGSKKDLYGKVDTKAAIWILADVPAELASYAAFVAPDAAEVKNVVGMVDLSKGASISLIAGFADDDKATAAATALQTLLDENKAGAPKELASAAESVKIEASGSDVKLSISATTDEITAGIAAAPL
jgi:hypothetical protein